jgi:hypothetical protein
LSIGNALYKLNHIIMKRLKIHLQKLNKIKKY